MKRWLRRRAILALYWAAMDAQIRKEREVWFSEIESNPLYWRNLMKGFGK